MKCSANKLVSGIFFLVVFLSCNTINEEKTPASVASIDAVENPNYAKFGYTKLSDYGFFIGDLKDLNPALRVLPYTLNAPLFTDYAEKARFIFLPEGETMTYHPTEVLNLPNGSAIIKNFYYTAAQLGGNQQRIIETRILLNKDGEWTALPYIWNNEQTEAYLDIMGGNRDITLANRGAFDYNIPNMKQCKTCHDYNGKLTPIGPSARQLASINSENDFLKQWNELKHLNGYTGHNDILAQPDAATATLNDRARAYLDGNCSYCHRPEGSAKNSGLDLTMYAPNAFALGINKAPVAAGKGSGGLAYDVVPGHPNKSILYYRMNSTDPAVMMPELGRSLVHTEGLALIGKWIEQMKQ